MDEWLTGLLAEEDDGVAVVAVGGYGRRELCPGSDLDVLLLHRGRRDIGEVAARLWYPIWDAGFDLDHSVRTTDEALSVASGDLRAMLGLLDARHVAGSNDLSDGLLSRARDHWRRHARRWTGALAGSMLERHARFGDVAFLLEPELKEGKGGLRDTGALAAITESVPVVGPDDVDVGESRDLLLCARVELHRLTGRRLDRLVLERQDEVAARLGFGDADELMQTVAAHGRRIAWVVDETWRRVDAWRGGPRRRSAAGGDRPVERGIVLRDGEVALGPGARPGEDASLPLRVAAASAYLGAPIARAALARLEVEAPAPATPWPDDTRHAFVALLGGGDAMVHVFETLDHHGLIVRMIPEWEHVRSKPQRNAFHRFTVDRHLLEAVAESARLIRDVTRPDLLLVAALLHDIGKGYPGDHTDAGVVLAEQIAARMGFPPADVDVVVTLVREHLLLARAATGRDLRDPATIRSVAAAVGSREVLELLAALTVADSIATGETAWSIWKAQLLGELVQRVTAAFAGVEPMADAPSAHAEAAAALAAAAGVVVEPRGDGRLRVVAEDRPGLLARVVGLLILHGQSVRSAQAWSGDDGVAVDEFEVEPVFDQAPDWAAFEADLREVLAGHRALDEPIAARARIYGRRPSAARPAEPRVLVHDEASDAATVVEVRAADAVGLLYRVTNAISGLGLDIRHAKVTTLGHEVVDTFYLRAASGGKLTAADLDPLRDAVLAELEG